MWPSVSNNVQGVLMKTGNVFHEIVSYVSCIDVRTASEQVSWLVRQSTTTQTASNSSNHGWPVTKSMERTFQRLWGTGNGTNTPNGACCRVRIRWQTWQISTNWSTSILMPSQKYFCLRCSNVFVLPGCPGTGLSWWSWNRGSRREELSWT